MANESGSGSCWFCGAHLGALEFGRSDNCKKCGRDTRTCKGCVFYDRSSSGECREPQAERITEKERSNFCDYFKPRGGSGETGASSKDAARAAAEALFKKN